MKINILALIFILFSLHGQSQDLIEKDVVGKMEVVKASISNMKNLAKMSETTFDSTLQNMGYSKFETPDGYTTFVKVTSVTGSHFVAKKSASAAIRWFHKGNSNTILENLLKELSPFYNAVLEDSRFYKITDGTTIYRFVTTVKDDSESVQLIGPRQGPVDPGQPGSRIIQVPIR